MSECSFNGCGRELYATALCKGHYQQQYRGTELRPLKRWVPSRDRDELGRKQCRLCQVFKPEAEFRRRNDREDKLDTRCRPCNRVDNLWRMYKITIHEYDSTLQSQGGGCGVCGTLKPGGGHENFSVDHDHSCCKGTPTCGKCNRSLLCRRCNLVLGAVDDRAELLVSLIEYLKHHKGDVDE